MKVRVTVASLYLLNSTEQQHSQMMHALLQSVHLTEGLQLAENNPHSHVCVCTQITGHILEKHLQ